MKVDEAAATRAALTAGNMAATQATLQLAQALADRIKAVDSGSSLSAYGQAYRKALVDAFDTLNPDEPTPGLPPQIWEP